MEVALRDLLVMRLDFQCSAVYGSINLYKRIFNSKSSGIKPEVLRGRFS
jgi:hypothetical protein